MKCIIHGNFRPWTFISFSTRTDINRSPKTRQQGKIISYGSLDRFLGDDNKTWNQILEDNTYFIH